MTSSSDFRTIALSLAGTTEAPHFDRRAFKVARTYATLAADGQTANLKLTPDEQEFKTMLARRKRSSRSIMAGAGRAGPRPCWS